MSAQSSVSIYGNLDQGYYSASEGGLKQSGVASNIGTTSVLGFKGAEDLGGGLSANFNLLSELSLKEGQMGSTTSGNAAAQGGQKPNIFTRGANRWFEDYDASTPAGTYVGIDAPAYDLHINIVGRERTQ